MIGRKTYMAVIVLIAFGSTGFPALTEAKKTKEVVVVNEATEPVPVTVEGGLEVSITNDESSPVRSR